MNQRLQIFRLLAFLWTFACCQFALAQVATPLQAGPSSFLSAQTAVVEDGEENWSLHMQNTIVIQTHPGIRAKYSGPSSLDKTSETHETVSLDLLAGLRLWEGAEIHLDGLMWEGYGLSNALGIAGFPNGEAFRKGTATPNGNISRAFIRQSIGIGSEMENAPGGALFLKGRQHVSRLTFTLGRMSAKDIFDNNAYSNDARTQFMNWSLMANGAWDYPADSLGYTTGGAAELYLHDWALRYGFFQVPSVSNGISMDPHIWKAWAQVMELEHKHEIDGHPGAVRFLAYMNRAHMGSFNQALNNIARPADIVATREYRIKFGFGLNADQEITNGVGVFTRLGWSNGAA